MWLWMAAIDLVIAAAVLVVFTRPGHHGGIAATMEAAGCTYRDVPPFPPKDRKYSDYHRDVDTLESPARWSTFPPAAGTHFRLWRTWGFYTAAVNPLEVVHNEEHGGVVIWWGPNVPAATIAQLRRFYDEQPVGMFGTPIAGLGSKIALTAWTADPTWKGEPGKSYFSGRYGMGRIAVCDRFEEGAFRAFRDAYRGHSPQGFPLKFDAPGCGPDQGCPTPKGGGL